VFVCVLRECCESGAVRVFPTPLTCCAGLLHGQGHVKRGRERENQLALVKERREQQALKERELQLQRRKEAVRLQLGAVSLADLQTVLYLGVERGEVFIVDRCIFAGAGTQFNCFTGTTVHCRN